MLKRIFTISITILVSLIFIFSCKSSGKSGGGNSDVNKIEKKVLPKENIVNYYTKIIEYYEGDEYQAKLKKYNDETKDIKDANDKQKKREEIFSDFEKKSEAIYKSFGFNNKQELLDTADKYSKDPDVQKLVFKAANYMPW